MAEASPTRDAIVAALRELGGDATSSEIRAKTGLGKTTVNDNLKGMVGAGILEKHGMPVGRYRLVEQVGAVDLPDTGDWDYKNPGGDEAPLSTPDADEMPSDTTVSAVSSEPASSGIDDVFGFMREHAPALPEEDVSEEAAKEVVRGVCTAPVERDQGDGSKRTVPCGTPIHKEGRSWVPDTGTVEEHGHTPTTKAFRAPRPPREPKGDVKHVNPNGASYGRGELKGKVLQFLRSSPDQSFKVAKIADGCAAFPGSTAFILKKLVASGEVRQTNEKPAEYQAA